MGGALIILEGLSLQGLAQAPGGDAERQLVYVFDASSSPISPGGVEPWSLGA